jgi:serine/threonine-protein kinase
VSPFRLRLDFSEEDRTFLQRRVGMYALTSFGIVVSFFVLDILSWPLLAPLAQVEDLLWVQVTSLWIEGGIAAGLLAAALVIRRGKPGVVHLYAFDGVVTFLMGLGFAGLVAAAPPLPVPIAFHIFLAIQSVLFVHAAVVPAPPFRTGILHVVACLPLLAVAWNDAHASQEGTPLERWATPTGLVVWTIAFGVIGAILTWVVFRLRLRVREAQKLGQYRLEKKLGEGGMGVVYMAQHGMLRRPTAIKLLPPEKTGEATVRRFEREVRNTSRLTHPNTVAIYDFGRTPDGVFYYAMELLDGLDLRRVVELDGPMPPGRVVHVLRQVAGALGEAHDLGLVHRDVKPENIVLCRRGGVPDVVKVVDFGLVKDLETPKDLQLSRADVLTGTPLYMSPEAISTPESLDGRADLYSLGVVAWFLLVGRPPFTGRSVIEVCAKHLSDPPRAPSTALGRSVPEDLEAIILRLLNKEPGYRYPSAEALDDALAAAADLGPDWTRSDAEAWWDAHQHHVAAPSSLAPSRPATLTVAVSER